MKKTIFTLIILILIAGCAKSQEERAIKKSDNKISLQLEASIYPSLKSGVLAESNGYIKKVYVQNGDKVQKGELIYSLNTELIKLDIKRLKYDIASLQKEKDSLLRNRGNNYNLPAVNLAGAELKKVAALRSKGIINQFEEDRYKRNYINALKAKTTTNNTSTIETTNRAIKADEVALEKLQYALNHSQVKANITGYIVNLNIQANQSVTLNQKVADIIDIDKVIVRAGVAPGLLAFIQKNEKVKINFITEPPYSQFAKINRINPIIDKKFKNMTLDMIVKNRNYILQPGTKALVTVYLTKKEQEKVKKIFSDRKGTIIGVQSDNK